MEPEVGNLYAAKGGRGTKFWLLIALKENGGAVLLGLDDESNIVSGQTYGAHALRHREVIGWINVEEINFVT